MKEIDESEEAVEFVTRRTQHLIEMGYSPEHALDLAAKEWLKSLDRAVVKNQVERKLRASNKPTLHVSLFEAAAQKRNR